MPQLPRAVQQLAGLDVYWHDVPCPDDVGARGAASGFGLWVPSNPDQLIDELTQAEFEASDERMPYFGLFWPSAEVLVRLLLSGARLAGQQVLDLGCGLGACGLAALRQDAAVTFFDWEPRALTLAAASVNQNGFSRAGSSYVVGDWRQPPRFGPFDRILGADVLYERRNGPAVAAFLAQHLRPGGEAWIADPGRPQARDFPDIGRAAGLELLGVDQHTAPGDSAAITVLRLGLA